MREFLFKRAVTRFDLVVFCGTSALLASGDLVSAAALYGLGLAVSLVYCQH